MFFILVLILIILLFIYDGKNKQYWLQRGVYSPPATFIFGHLINFLSGNTPVWEIMNKHRYKPGKSFKMIGLYEMFTPKIFLIDPHLIKHVMVNDFEYFMDRRNLKNMNTKDNIERSLLINLSGEKWRAMRNVIGPMFSAERLKTILPLIENEAQKLKNVCHSAIHSGKSINIVELSGKYSLNVIQSCAFGTNGEGFDEKPSQLFSELKNMFSHSFTFGLKFFLILISPKLFNLLGLSFATPSQIRLNKYLQDIIIERRQAVPNRVDFLSYMIEAEKDGIQLQDGNTVINDDDIVSLSLLFMFTGFDRVKSILSFVIHNVAKYPKEQEKLRAELRRYACEDRIDYQTLQELHYLDAFISETMRVFPSSYVLERCCTKDYNIPDTDVIIPEGMMVTIPAYCLHYDPTFWEDPEEFCPERFLEQSKINSGTFLPFGIGPRSCIGNTFALLEIKMAVAKLLLSFDIKLQQGTSLKLDKTFLAMKPDEQNGIQVVLTEL